MLEALFGKFGSSFKAGEIIFCEQEHGADCYFLLEGKVKISKNVGSSQKILDIIEKGNFFGEMAILEAEPRSASAIALDSVQVLKFNRSNFDTMLQGQPQLALRLLFSFSKRIYDAKRRLQILLLKDPELKVSDVFIMLSEKDPGYGKFQKMIFNVSVDDVASWCGMPLAEVQKIIDSFAKRGKIELYPDHIVIPNINDFTRIVNYHRKNLLGQ